MKSCGGGTWASGFLVTGKAFKTGAYQEKYTYPIGETGTRTENNEHKVTNIEVGLNLSETAATNTSGGVNTVPKSVGFENKSNYDTAIVDTSGLSSSVQAYIPYNYINTTRITTKDDDNNEHGTTGTLYAGESKTINYEYSYWR